MVASCSLRSTGTAASSSGRNCREAADHLIGQLTDSGGSKTGSRGTKDEGLATVTVTSKEFAGSTETVTLDTF